MAYNLRFYHNFKDETGQQWTIEIYRDIVTPPAQVEIECGESPIVLSYRNSGDEKYSNIKSSVAIINIYVTTNFDYRELVTFNEREFKVILKKGSYTYWVGYLISDTYQEQYTDTPYTFQVRAIDGLGMLKYTNFHTGNIGETNIPRENHESILDGIRFCLSTLSLSLPVIEGVNIQNTLHTYTTTTSTLSSFNYDPQVFAKTFLEDGEVVIEPGSCYNALEGFLKSFTARIYQRFYGNEAVWWIERINEKNHYPFGGGGIAKPYYRKWGTNVGDAIIGSEFEVDDQITLDDPSSGTWNTDGLFVDSDQMLEYGKPYYKVVNTFNTDGRSSGVLIEEGNFENAAWTNSTTLTNWTKDGGGTLIEKSGSLIWPHSDFSVKIFGSGNGWLLSTQKTIKKADIGNQLHITLWTKQIVSPVNGYNTWWSEVKPEIRIQIRISNAKDSNDVPVGTQYLTFNYNTPNFSMWNSYANNCILHPNPALNHEIIADIDYYGDIDIKLYQADYGLLYPYQNQPWYSIMADYDIWYDYININILANNSKGPSNIVYTVTNNSTPANNTTGIYEYAQPLGDENSGTSRGAIYYPPSTYTGGQWTRRSFVPETEYLGELNANEIMRNYAGVQRRFSGSIRVGTTVSFWNTILISETIGVTTTVYYLIAQSFSYDIRGNRISGEWLANITSAVNKTVIIKTKFENVGVELPGGGGQTAKIGSGGGSMSINDIGGMFAGGNIEVLNAHVIGVHMHEATITDTSYVIDPVVDSSFQSLDISGNVTFNIRKNTSFSSNLVLSVYNSNGSGVTLTLGYGFVADTASSLTINFTARQKKTFTFQQVPEGYLLLHTVTGKANGTIDTDASTYIAALGTLTDTEEWYIIYLISELKAKGLWSKALAIYPFPTAVQADCQVNMVTPGTFDLTFTGTWAFARTGATADNSDAFTPTYADTGVAANVPTLTGYGLTTYTRLYEQDDDITAIGAYSLATGTKVGVKLYNDSSRVEVDFIDLNTTGVSVNDSRGVTHFTYNSGVKLYKNNSKIINGSTAYTGVAPTHNIYIGGLNNNGTADELFNNEICFAAIWDTSFSDAEAEDLFNILQTAQNILDRKIDV